MLILSFKDKVFYFHPEHFVKQLVLAFKLITPMKTFKLLVFLFCLSLVAKAQSSYTPFPDSNATWQVNYYNSGSGGSYGQFNPLVTVYTQTGDTIVSGISYYKLDTGKTYAGGLRQDVSNRKVYYLPPDSTKDTLLYDFNLKVGDTLPLSYINHCDTSIVTSIDSQLIGSSYYKTFNFSCTPTFIEGIGSVVGLLESVPPGGFFESAYILACFNVNLVAQHTPGINCSEMAGVMPTTPTDTIYIFPNPATDLVSIEFSSSKTGTLELLDAQGRTMKEQPLADDKTYLNLTGLSAGLYLLHITTPGGSSFTKLVKE